MVNANGSAVDCWYIIGRWLSYACKVGLAFLRSIGVYIQGLWALVLRSLIFENKSLRVGILFKYVEVWSKIIHFVRSLNKDSSNWFAEDGERGVDKKTDKSLDKHLSVDAVAEFANA